MLKRSISLKGHRTSIALEAPFWRALETFAELDSLSLPRFIEQIDRARIKQSPAPGLASALRVYILERTQRDGALASGLSDNAKGRPPQNDVGV